MSKIALILMALITAHQEGEADQAKATLCMSAGILSTSSTCGKTLDALVEAEYITCAGNTCKLRLK